MIIGSQQAVGLYAARLSTAGVGTSMLAGRGTGSKAQPGRGSMGEASVLQTSAKAGTGSTEGVFSKQGPVDTLRSGFGNGTVSVPTMAIRTIGEGLSGARQTVPTIEELQQEHRARIAEQRKAQAEAIQKSNTSPLGIESSRSVGLATGQNQVLADRLVTTGQNQVLADTLATTEQNQSPANGLGESALTSQIRIGGETAPTQGPTSTVRVSGQALDYIRAQTDAKTDQPPTFNVLI